jgi:DNA helicase-2/ATP-dependent DNA helicase PcrA
MNYLSELNDSQRQAVECTDGPVMIIAGAGSGKTKVLTNRIAYLMENGADPFNILALTFTNKAAREMRERIENVVGTDARNLWMGTFHSIFARILRYEAEKIGFPSNFTIYDTYDSRSLLKTIINEQGLNDKTYKPNLIHNRISGAKNNLISPEQYANHVDLISDDESNGRGKTAKIYELYWKRCFQAGAMDFDDLLFRTYLLLEKHPEVLYKYQHLFQFILIDEYQDTNYAQYQITHKLADVHQNICVVGDDAQSIYAFRGANIQNIFNFQKDYSDLNTFKLEQNYRSSKIILHAANDVIANNKQQIPKELWTNKEDGDRIRVVRCMSDNEEGRLVADNIFEMKMRHQFLHNDFAILYRTNSQSRAFEEAMRRLNIPYTVYGGISFYQRKEIKDLIAYLRLTMNHHDEEALRRVINYPTRGIGQTSLEKVAVVADQTGKRYWEVIESINERPEFNARTKGLISDFVTMIKSFATMVTTHNAHDLAYHIAKSSGVLRDLHEDKSVEGLARYENIEELLNGIKEFSDDDDEATGSEDKSLGAYLQNISLLTDADQEKEDQDTVKIMTLHAAKGLEFKNVYLVGLEENLFPSMMALNTREELEEERRLFYVGITRAMQHASLYYAVTRYRFGQLIHNEPSRFIEEISDRFLDTSQATAPKLQRPAPKPAQDRVVKTARRERLEPLPEIPNFKADDLADLQSGMEVVHQRFGAGKVINLEGDPSNKIATIFFKSHGQKRIMLKYAKLQILGSNEVK